jgi:hypothetical protein
MKRRLKFLGLILLTAGALTMMGGVWGWFALTRPFCGSARPMPGAGAMKADPARIRSEVETLCAAFAPRDHAHPDNLDRAADFIASRFQQAGAVTERQGFEVRRVRYQNVTARFGPDTREVVVVGAHYDTAGDQPGADDNASGVAGVLELARLLAGEPLKSRVELVAYTLEEPPHFRTEHMGSAVHARSLSERNAEVRLMVAVEMIGYYSDAPDSQEFPMAFLKAFYPSRGNFAAVVGKWGQGGTVCRVKRAMRQSGGIPVHALHAPTGTPGTDLSDHRNYWSRGWPAVMVTDTAFMRNERYHTVEDTPDTLDYERMARVAEGLRAVVREFAGK